MTENELINLIFSLKTQLYSIRDSGYEDSENVYPRLSIKDLKYVISILEEIKGVNTIQKK